MSARDAILGRLARPVSADIDSQAAALVTRPERPPDTPGGLVGRFVAQLGAPSVAATVDRVTNWSELPDAVETYLAGHGLPPAFYLPPDPKLAACDWGRFTLTGEAATDQPAAIALAIAGVAETGSLVFETGPTAPMLPNFLTLHHLVAIETSRIVATLEEIGGDPACARAHYWVTGVSGTTDIEGQYVRGAHGPRFLHVLLIG